MCWFDLMKCSHFCQHDPLGPWSLGWSCSWSSPHSYLYYANSPNRNAPHSCQHVALGHCEELIGKSSQYLKVEWSLS